MKVTIHVPADATEAAQVTQGGVAVAINPGNAAEFDLSAGNITDIVPTQIVLEGGEAEPDTKEQDDNVQKEKGE